MVEDDAVNSIEKRTELETRVHKSLVQGAAQTAAAASSPPSSRPYRPRRRMSLHRGTDGMVPSLETSPKTVGGRNGRDGDLYESEVAAILSARLDGGESDIIELPTINATVVHRSGGIRGRMAEGKAEGKAEVVVLKGKMCVFLLFSSFFVCFLLFSSFFFFFFVVNCPRLPDF
jgi:hypothetical protein